MKAFVYHGSEQMSLDQVPMPRIEKPGDAIIRVTTSTICGTDKHIRHGGIPQVQPGRIMGHEFCGEVHEVGPGVSKFKKGDRVAVSCVTQCMMYYYCKRGLYSQCTTGSWIFGYLIDGCQADYVRVPYADSSLHLIPEGLDDEDVLFVGDILSTGYFGAENGAMPYTHAHRSGVDSLRLFAQACGLHWQGGFVLGGGAMLDGQPLEKHMSARRVVPAFDTFVRRIAAGEPSPDSLYELAQPDPASCLPGWPPSC